MMRNGKWKKKGGEGGTKPWVGRERGRAAGLGGEGEGGGDWPGVAHSLTESQCSVASATQRSQCTPLHSRTAHNTTWEGRLHSARRGGTLDANCSGLKETEAYPVRFAIRGGG